ncbi:ribonuclease P protein component, putative [Rhodospirillum centenum SW]|uniref:Ribonuclease P protein component n=1 Tax=Rhodospirillum centenum (strain ATCC 51521 / SW) TaxID=414684 RepID=B6IPG7_RHOCS|nr:ribonuclease P protein component, putative [Rhodospirillum centenum SW]
MAPRRDAPEAASVPESAFGNGPGVGRLTRRPQFLAVAGARRKWAAPGLILQARAHDERQHPRPDEPSVRVGFTASKKVGGAVERNRARRRLRAAVAEVLAPHAAAGYDFVLVARGETVRRPWPDLKNDLATALKRLKAWRDGVAMSAATAPPAADGRPDTVSAPLADTEADPATGGDRP